MEHAISCTPPIRTFTAARNQPVWSQGGATNQGLSDVFVFTGDQVMQLAPLLSQARATLIVDNRTLNAEIEVVMQSTLDGVTWSNPIVLSQAWVNTNGPDITAWHTNAADFTRGVRFGVRIRQAAGTAVEMARVSLILDLQLKS